MPRQQLGYFATFFHAPETLPKSNNFYGAHPYPVGSSHKWEIAANFGDYTTDANGNDTTVQWNRWYSQALVVTPAGSNSALTFYWDLPNAAKKIVATVPALSPASGQVSEFWSGAVGHSQREAERCAARHPHVLGESVALRCRE